MLSIDDYIILNEQIGDLVPNSVGIVKEISTQSAKVFFIGKEKTINIDISKIKFLDVNKTGKPYKYKICNVCYVLKEYYKDFDINQTDAKGKKTTRPTCIECRKAIDGKKLKPSEKKRMNAIKPKNYFICPICGKTSIPDVTAKLVIDHNHLTGMAREWICDSCNTGLGRFKDNVEIMEEAIKYVKKHQND